VSCKLVEDLGCDGSAAAAGDAKWIVANQRPSSCAPAVGSATEVQGEKADRLLCQAELRQRDGLLWAKRGCVIQQR